MELTELQQAHLESLKALLILEDFVSDTNELVIHAGTTFEELGFDVYDHLSFLMDVEDDLNIEISDEQVPDIKSLYDVIVLLPSRT